MLILHFCLTPLAAAPYRICEALNMLDGVTARSIVLDAGGYSNLSFPSDLIWTEHKEEILTLLESADLLHLHNYVGLDCDKFAPIDFQKLWDKDMPMVRHFHSTPELICNYLNITSQQLDDCPIPKLVISQYPERFYPNAKVIPNVVTEFHIAGKEPSSNIRIGYSPSNFRHADEKRWDTKGYHETKFLLHDFVKKAEKQGFTIELDIMEKVAFKECLRRKSECDIVIDDLVTGSYHMSALEGLASGTVVLTFADNRVISETMKLTQGQFLPVINTKLEELQDILFHLIKNRPLIEVLKENAHKWMQTYWQPKNRAQKFVDIYKEVIADPKIQFPLRYDPTSRSDTWYAIEQYDVAWKARHKSWPVVNGGIIGGLKIKLYKAMKRFNLK
ncbi:MAG: glycosyltransferase involved in cell wall biosynthesis [Paraglaciecola sp.]|jgi:glycosyltransferase involved in cell wall biosynthesis